MNPLLNRKKALEILLQVEARGAFASQLLSKSAKDRALNYPLLQTLVKGTLQWKARIDSELESSMEDKWRSLPPEIRNLLRLAAYQLLFLKDVPERIVYKETVSLTRYYGLEDPAKLVRPLFQSLLHKRTKRAAVSRENRSESPEAIAVHYSHPLWLVERWVAELGLAETRALCQANNKPWRISIRTNTLRISTHQLRKLLKGEGVRISPSSWLEDCTLIDALPRSVRLNQLDSFRRGFFQVQDESAALVSLLLNPAPGSFVVDVCSAPGGKTTHLAELMRNKGRILALDSNSVRLKTVEVNCRRLGVRIVDVKAADAAQFKLKKAADHVLLDAPCSGLGTIGRKTEIRWAKSAENIRELAVLQLELLKNASRLVRKGGRLVYSTCTVEREENESVIEAFLKEHPEFTVHPPPAALSPKLFSPAGFLRTWPHIHGIGGAFAACLTHKMFR